MEWKECKNCSTIQRMQRLFKNVKVIRKKKTKFKGKKMLWLSEKETII